MTVNDIRPPGRPALFRPGTSRRAVVTFDPTSTVPGHTWTATLGGDALPVTTEPDDGRVTVDVPAEVTAEIEAVADWFLLQDGEPFLHSRWTPSFQPGAGGDLEYTVVVQDLEITVQVTSLVVGLPDVIDGGTPDTAGSDMMDGGAP